MRPISLRSGNRRTIRGHLCALVALGAVLGACGGSSSPTVSANLGPMASDTPEPSSGVFGFQRAGPARRQRSKVQFLVFDTLWDPGSALDRWAEVKALEQFGTWTGQVEGQTTVKIVPTITPNYAKSPSTPTFDLSHATYTSRYVAFVHQVMQAKPLAPPTRLPPAQQVLLTRYGHLSEHIYPEDQTLWPVILVGGYAMHGQVVTSPIQTNMPGLTTQKQLFAWFQRETVHGGKDPEQEYWVVPLNDFANTIVAVICHADGQRPAAACKPPVIHSIEHRLP